MNGVTRLVKREADDALGSAAKLANADPSVDRVYICTPDKDMGQCVTSDGRVVQLDRREGKRGIAAIAASQTLL